jgi:hypothetical protein
MRLKKVSFRTIAWSVAIALIVSGGLLLVWFMPEAVEHTFVRVDTISLTQKEYVPTVNGTGVLTKFGTTWYAVVAVGEGDIGKVQVGQKVDLSGAALGKGKYTATVRKIGDVARQQSIAMVLETVVDVTLEVDNPDKFLKSGYTVQASIHVDDKTVMDILPYSVIRQDENGEYVYVVENRISLLRYIKTGRELPEGAEIIEGLTGNEKIVKNPDEVKHGSIVSLYQGNNQ